MNSPQEAAKHSTQPSEQLPIEEQVILVNAEDEMIGSAEKLFAHQRGLLHRAFSVLLFNEDGHLLLQQRAAGKYHSAGLWSNACCSHPRLGEEVAAAASRRLLEELQIQVPLQYIGKVKYHASFDNGLVEHELDHVFTGKYSGAVSFNAEEVQACKYMPLQELETSLVKDAQLYTPWLPIVLDLWKRAAMR